MWRVVTLLLFLAAACFGQTNEALKNQIHQAVEKVLKCSGNINVPGFSLAVVKNGETITADGWGKRDISLPDSDPLANVTKDTKFCIASMGKIHTAILMGKLMDEHAQNPRFPFTVNWYTKAKQLMGPEFRIVDDLRTEQTSVRDTLSHKLGIPYYDGPWWYGLDPNKTREDYCMRLGYLDSTWGYREYFTYSDMTFVLATCLTEKIGGDSYNKLIKEKLYDPLGMTNTTFPLVDNDWRTFALPYSWSDSESKTIPINPKLMEDSGYPGDGAGGHWSTASNMATWLKFLLSRGMHDGQRVVSDDVFYNVYWPENPQSPGGNRKPQFPFFKRSPNYGLGIYLGSYRGYRKYSHGGGWFGFSSHNSFYPDKNIGIYSASNGNDGNLHEVLHNHIADLALGLQPILNDTTLCTFPRPWGGDSKDQEDPRKHRTNHKQRKESRRHRPNNEIKEPVMDNDVIKTPSLQWHEPFVGTFGHKTFGNMTVFYNSGDPNVLQYTIGRFGEGTLTRRGPVTFNIIYGGMLSYSSTDSTLWFQKEEGGLYQELVHQDYQWDRPPVFTRGLQWDPR